MVRIYQCEVLIMAYQALYRKWRPLSFNDVVGQGHIVTTLKNEILSGKAAHAYLFCGTRGTGKTSCAKIFARAINCLNPKDGNPCNECEICRGALDGSVLDIVEIDAASNNGVDNIREIREEVSYSAAQAKYKIYIIDEVHMLSGGAFNALLKTLEEPPAHVVFILATTEAHKLPATITSRCQRFDFKRISVRDIVVRMREIVTAENIDIDIEALELIAQLADGAMRDALSILDQCVGASDGKITLDAARSVLSITSDENISNTVDAIYKKDTVKIISILADIAASGKDMNNFMEMLVNRFRDILVCKVSKTADGLFECSDETLENIKKASAYFDSAQLSYIIETLCSACADAKWQKNARTLYELALMRLCDERLNMSSGALLARIEKLESMISGGVSYSPQTAPSKADDDISSDTKEDDIPPWDIPEEEKQDTAYEQAEPLPKEPYLDTPLAQESPVIKKPVQKEEKRAEVKSPSGISNVWGELLLVLEKKYPPLYGTLSMKKAKFANDTLYIINETYVKQIVTMMKNDFDDALGSVVGHTIKVNFVTEAEFDMIDDESADVCVAKDTETKTDNKTDTKEAAIISDDPLDALLNLGNEDIIIEE